MEFDVVPRDGDRGDDVSGGREGNGHTWDSPAPRQGEVGEDVSVVVSHEDGSRRQEALASRTNLPSDLPSQFGSEAFTSL